MISVLICRTPTKNKCIHGSTLRIVPINRDTLNSSQFPWLIRNSLFSAPKYPIRSKFRTEIMLAILYNKQLCCLSQEQNVIRNPSAKFGSETKRFLASRWQQNLGNVNIGSHAKRNCSALLPETKLILFVTLSGIAPLRYLKRNYCASLPETKLICAFLQITTNHDCRVIRIAHSVPDREIELLRFR